MPGAGHSALNVPQKICHRLTGAADTHEYQDTGLGGPPGGTAPSVIYFYIQMSQLIVRVGL